MRAEPQDPSLAALIPSECNVTYIAPPGGRVPALIDRGLRAAGILDKSWSWQRSAYESCRRIIAERQIDAIVTSSPPHSVHLLGLALKRKVGLPWVADFRDPWVGDGAARGMKRFAARLEAKVLRGADAVVANAPLAQQVLAEAYPDIADKLVTITNGYDPEAIPPPTIQVSPHSPITILHAGELYAGRDPRPLLDAIASIKDASDLGLPEFRVAFLGRHKWSGLDLLGEIKNRGCDDIVDVVEHLPYADAKQRMVDAGILLLLDSAGRQAGVPAKLYEYIGCQRPVLALVEQESDSAWVLRESGMRHCIANPASVPGVQRALIDLLVNLTSGETLDTGPREACFNGRFTRAESAQQLAAVLRRVTGTASQAKPFNRSDACFAPRAV